RRLFGRVVAEFGGQHRWLFRIVASMAFRLHLAGLAIIGASLLGIVGCGGDEGATAGDVGSDAQTRVRGLANEYAEFMTANQGRVPKDEAEFRKFLEPRSKTVGASFKIETVDELLTSPRDKQPLVIVTGTKREPSDAPGAPWAFRERVGVDGKIFAVGVRY